MNPKHLSLVHFLRKQEQSTERDRINDDLRVQLRALTNANLDLRSQLKEQSGTIEQLKAEFEGLRNEKKLGTSKPSSGPKSPRKKATALCPVEFEERAAHSTSGVY